jgi:hypothetical protein
MGFIIFMTVLLTVPFLNLIAGAFVGLGTLVHLLKTGHFGRLLLLAVVAAGWFPLAIWESLSAAGENPFQKVPWVLLAFPVAGMSFLFVKMLAETGKKGSMEQLSLANGLGKGSFSLDLGFGTIGDGHLVLIDPKAKSVAFLAEKTHRVEPLSFIKSWEVTWTNVQRGGLQPNSPQYTSEKNFRLKINTYDFEHPIFYAAMPNRAAADHWSERLDNLFHSAQPQPQPT